MDIGWKQSFKATWTKGGESAEADYDVFVEVTGPAREMMTDAAPIIGEIGKLDGANLHDAVGKSSLEAVTLYIQDIVNKHLNGTPDTLKSLKLVENGMFSAAV